MKPRLSRSRIWLALLLGLVLSSLLWQFGELKIQAVGESLIHRLTGKPLNRIEKLDAEGIPYQLYREQGARYNPLFIARRAQALAGNPEPAARAEFRKLSDWLLKHSTYQDSSRVCFYTFDMPNLGLKAPWPSALAQAVILNVFQNRAVTDQDSLWAGHAREVFHSLQEDAGLGLCSRLDQDKLWWWEYPGPDSLFVLNGMISVLFELWDYHQSSRDPGAKALFEQGYQAVLHKLPEYDRHGYSRYASRGETAGRLYHQKHIMQLQRLNSIKANPLLSKYLKRWRRHDNLPMPWQLIFKHGFWRLFSYLATWLGLSLLLLVPGLIKT